MLFADIWFKMVKLELDLFTNQSCGEKSQNPKILNQVEVEPNKWSLIIVKEDKEVNNQSPLQKKQHRQTTFVI